METSHEPARRSGARWAVLAAAVGIVGWWVLRPSSVPPDVATPAAPESARHSAEPERPAQLEPVNFVHGVPVRPAGSAEVNAEGMVPHPLTPQHERIFRENNLIANLNGAMDVRDAAGLRRLLERYRNEYPEDAHVLQDGYELIIDCLERPGVETRSAAQRYYDEQLDSGLRRYIRRHCLEAAKP